MAGKRNKKWVQKSVERMKEKGTIGAFGKATPKKIARAKKHGGLEKKRAVWAENLKKSRNKKKRKSGRH